MFQSRKVPFGVKDAEKTENEKYQVQTPEQGKKNKVAEKNERTDFKNNLFLLSTKHVLPADLEPARPISFFHISCSRLFFHLCWLCM